MIQAMKHISVNDGNKRLLREEGALPLLERALVRTSVLGGGKGGDAADLCVATLLLLSFEEGSRCVSLSVVQSVDSERILEGRSLPPRPQRRVVLCKD